MNTLEFAWLFFPRVPYAQAMSLEAEVTSETPKPEDYIIQKTEIVTWELIDSSDKSVSF